MDVQGVRVRDHGTGFPPQFAEHAFERFARADSGRSTGGAGPWGPTLRRTVGGGSPPRTTFHLRGSRGELLPATDWLVPQRGTAQRWLELADQNARHLLESLRIESFETGQRVAVG